MNKGDIIVVPARPCKYNDVVKVMDNDESTYPVYAVVRTDYEVGVRTEVYTSEGRQLSPDWWFKDKEVLVLEEA